MLARCLRLFVEEKERNFRDFCPFSRARARALLMTSLILN